MTKYSRFTGKVFGGNATATGADPQIAQFGSALANTFVGTTDPETIQSLPAWGQGWVGAVTPETQFPALPEMTGVMKVMSHQICGIQQQGVPEWDNGTIYYNGNFCSKNGIIYVSTIDENQGNDPENDTVNWRNYGGANLDLSNLSSQGKNIANWSTNVTNCIAEIPQRINITLSDGTLTLKAGSKVIVPNGFEANGTTPKFDYVTINSDISYTHNGNITCFVVLRNNTLGIEQVQWSFSGETAPTGNTYLMWYDTENNLVKKSSDSGSTWTSGWSLPLCIASETTTNGFVSIDQVFNGFGYIGSTIWVDKGVKGLIPNGRNEDGSLKNIEVITDSLKTYTYASTYNANSVFTLFENTINQFRQDWTYVSETMPNSTTSMLWYKPSENKRYFSADTITWVENFSVICGSATIVNGVISNFQPKLPFRAVDYNEKTEIISWGLPDWANTITISSNSYTCPSLGWVKIYVESTNQTNATFTINNQSFRLALSSGNYVNSGNVLLPVNKGDVVSCSATTKNYYFIPMKGVN